MTLASRAVLVVEDEPQLRRMLRTLLELENFRVIEADSAERGLAEARTHKPDLLIVDSGFPDRDGTEVITGVRSWSRVPIIVLSARTDESDKVGALEAGADDYITKPFGARELSARVQVALRHAASAGAAGATLLIGVWRIDLKARTARDDSGRELHLTPIEYRLLEVLAQHIGLVVTHRTLLQQVWGPGSAQQTHYLRVYRRMLVAQARARPGDTAPGCSPRPHFFRHRLAQRELT